MGKRDPETLTSNSLFPMTANCKHSYMASVKVNACSELGKYYVLVLAKQGDP